MEGIEIILTLQCVKCGHRWIRRLIKSPKCCPKCKCRKWDKERNRSPRFLNENHSRSRNVQADREMVR